MTRITSIAVWVWLVAFAATAINTPIENPYLLPAGTGVFNGNGGVASNLYDIGAEVFTLNGQSITNWSQLTNGDGSGVNVGPGTNIVTSTNAGSVVVSVGPNVLTNNQSSLTTLTGGVMAPTVTASGAGFAGNAAGLTGQLYQNQFTNYDPRASTLFQVAGNAVFDDFNEPNTLPGTLGNATSGQAYTLFGNNAAQPAVNSGVTNDSFATGFGDTVYALVNAGAPVTYVDGSADFGPGNGGSYHPTATLLVPFTNANGGPIANGYFFQQGCGVHYVLSDTAIQFDIITNKQDNSQAVIYTLLSTNFPTPLPTNHTIWHFGGTIVSNTFYGFAPGMTFKVTDTNISRLSSNYAVFEMNYGGNATTSESVTGHSFSVGTNQMTNSGGFLLGSYGGWQASTIMAAELVDVGPYGQFSLQGATIMNGSPTNADWYMFGADDNHTITGGTNILMGYHVGHNGTTMDHNVAIGQSSMGAATSASADTFLGWDAGGNDSTGSQNTGAGYQTLSQIGSGADNTAVGYEALKVLNGPNYNTGIGALALSALTNTSGSQSANGNTAIGYDAASSQTASNNTTAIGNLALQNNLGSGNTAIGASAGSAQTTGIDNIYIGLNAVGMAGEIGAIYIGGNYSTVVNIGGNGSTWQGSNGWAIYTSIGTNIAIGSQGWTNTKSGVVLSSSDNSGNTYFNGSLTANNGFEVYTSTSTNVQNGGLGRTNSNVSFGNIEQMDGAGNYAVAGTFTQTNATTGAGNGSNTFLWNQITWRSVQQVGVNYYTGLGNGVISWRQTPGDIADFIVLTNLNTSASTLLYFAVSNINTAYPNASNAVLHVNYLTDTCPSNSSVCALIEAKTYFFTNTGNSWFYTGNNVGAAATLMGTAFNFGGNSTAGGNVYADLAPPASPTNANLVAQLHWEFR